MLSVNSLDPDQARQMSGLIWIQTIWLSGGNPERIFWQRLYLKKSADDKKAQNFPEGKELMTYLVFHSQTTQV